MIERYVLNNRIDGWSGLGAARKQELIEQARYNVFADKKGSGKELLMPFLLLLAAGLLIVALVVINKYYLGDSTGFYLGGLLLILIALTEAVSIVRATSLIDELKKCMKAQQ